MPDLTTLLDNRAIVSALSAVAGALFWNFVALHRARVRILEYSVDHERIGLTTDDAVFGSVAVTWQGLPTTNLYLSTVVVKNNTSADYSGLRFKVYTGDTLLLTERRSIKDSAYVPEHTAEFVASTRVATGEEPTPVQQQIYWHSREYAVPVLNRGQQIELVYLTTVPDGHNGPAVWVDAQHQGLALKFLPNTPQIHGVPVSLASAIGLGAFVLLTGVLVWLQPASWPFVIAAGLLGLVAQSVGAGLYRIGRVLWRIIFH